MAEEIIWSDGSSSEFKNQFMCFLVQKLSSTYKKKFTWKFSASSHGKGAVDGVGGRVKSNVHTKIMSLGRDWIIFQDARSFCQLASTLCDKTTVIHVMADEIDT